MLRYEWIHTKIELKVFPFHEKTDKTEIFTFREIVTFSLLISSFFKSTCSQQIASLKTNCDFDRNELALRRSN